MIYICTVVHSKTESPNRVGKGVQHVLQPPFNNAKVVITITQAVNVIIIVIIVFVVIPFEHVSLLLVTIISSILVSILIIMSFHVYRSGPSFDNVFFVSILSIIFPFDRIHWSVFLLLLSRLPLVDDRRIVWFRWHFDTRCFTYGWQWYEYQTD